MTLHQHLNRLDGAREVQGFQDQPAQMRAAAPGKVGQLRLGFSMRNGRSVLHDLYRVTPLLVQQALYWDEEMPELPICSIISIGGGILQGDRYKIDISVGEGACAHVHSQSANRIHRMDANYASQAQTVRVEAGAYLEYLPDFTIPYRGSRFINESDLIVAEDATVLYGEMMMTGRKHHHADERFGLDLLSVAVSVSRPDGRKLFAEEDPDRAGRSNRGLLCGDAGLRCLCQHHVPDAAGCRRKDQRAVREPLSDRGRARVGRCLTPAERCGPDAAGRGRGKL